MECGEKIKEASGLDPKEIKSYPVVFDFDQDFMHEHDSSNKVAPSDSFIGLVKPMEVGEIDPYTKERLKPRKEKIRTSCCCIPCCCGKKIHTQTKEFIMTYEFGDKSKPQIVLIHGFGGSALIFFKLFQRLKEKYHVILIDLLGMGCSSRPPFLARTKEEAEAYYIQSIEKWREQMKLEKMNLVAHSFGGYIASRYTLKYPERVTKLILWSPHGTEPKPENYEEELDKRMKNSCRFRCFIKTVGCMFKNKCNPLGYVRWCGRCLGPYFLKRYIRRRLVSLTKEEKLIVYKYFYQVSMMPNSGEESIFKIMENPILAYTSIFYEVDKIIEKGTKIYFVYGDRDWIDTDMGGKHISAKLKESGYKVYMLNDCDHHLYLDQPEELLDSLDDCMSN